MLLSRMTGVVAGVVLGVTLLAAVALTPVSVLACPFCSAPSLTLTEQLAGADATVLVKWAGGTVAKANDTGATEFEVVEVVHQQAGGQLAKGTKISLIRYRSGRAGDLFLLLGTLGGGTIEWGSPLEVTQPGFDYMKHSPKPDQPAVQRLGYFLKFLEHPDKMIGDDAFGEFANASYADVVLLAKEMPRDKLRGWLTAKETSAGRLGLYGMMLGLCGTEADVKLMEQKILETTDDFRLGIDGVMGGYLLLTGDKGLAVIDEKKLKDKKAPFSETYAAMQALRFMWQYGDGRISLERLRQSMRILLERPELADLVIADLSRMKDWSMQDRLMTMYDEEAYNVPSIKRAIVRYMLAATKDTGAKKPVEDKATGDKAASEKPAVTEVAAPPAESLPHVVHAQECLAEIEKKDPKTVTEAKRFFLLK